MTALDTKLRATATGLLVKYGKSVTLTAVTPGAYNPATGQSTTSTSDTTAQAFIETYGKGEIFSSGGLVVMGDKKLTFAAADVTKPEPGDTVTIDSVVWTVIFVDELWSGEQVAAYVVQVRK